MGIEYRQLERIVKECFWDLEMTPDGIMTILRSGDVRRKKNLFEKILLNSSRLYKDMMLFDSAELASFIESYVPGAFNHDYVCRRVTILEVLFLEKPLTHRELVWHIQR